MTGRAPSGGQDVGLPPGRFDWSTPLPSPAELGRVHLLAVGGIGMSAVARLLHGRGVPVSGCDAQAAGPAQRLPGEGIPVRRGHDPSHLADVDTVVVSSAVRDDNAELVAARAAGLRVLHRAQALAVAASGHTTVAVAGANGKTTTTAMLAEVLVRLGTDPMFAVGGELVGAGTNAAVGSGQVAVLEADESDGSFVVYRPQVAVVTSVQPDHLDFYRSFEAVERAYRTFVTTIRPGGVLVVCEDDPGSADLGRWARERGVRVVGYGRSDGVDRQVCDLVTAGTGGRAVLCDRAGGRLPLSLPVPGWFNVLNATAVVGAAVDGLLLPAERVVAALAQFSGTRRRFERRGTAGGVLVVDDYAHNPAKVAAVVDAGRGVVGAAGRLVVCFQPHLYSRTADFAAEFGAALSGADLVVVLDVYAAREDPVPGVSGRLVADAVDPRVPVHYLPDRAGVAERMAALVRPGDLVLTVGAGDVTGVGPALLELLEGSTTNPVPEVEGV